MIKLSRENILSVIVILMAIAIGMLFMRDFFGFWQSEGQQPEITQSISDKPKGTDISPHQEMVDQIEFDAGMRLSRLIAIETNNEGERQTSYLDTAGAVTIGIGRSLATYGISVDELYAIVPAPNYKHLLQHARIANGRIYIHTLEIANKVFTKPLTKHDVGLLLADDLAQAQKDAVSVFGQDRWNAIDEIRKEAILDVVFNLGLPHFKGFHHFIQSVKDGDWEKAGNDLLLSEAARENILRYHRDASVIRTGDAKYFGL